MATNTLRSKVFTASGTFNVPPNVSSVLVSGIGGGGSGCGSLQQAGGSGGGGSGEFFLRVPYAVTPGGNVAVTIGIGGAAVTGPFPGPGGPGLGGSSTIFGLLVARGGGTRNAGGNPPEGTAGGGYLDFGNGGSTTPQESDGVFGTPSSWGFTGGGGGGGSCAAANPSRTGAASINFAGGPGGDGFGTGLQNGSGGGGASSPWGIGGTGGTRLFDGGTGIGCAPAAPATSYGAGGGGAARPPSTGGATSTSAAGVDGYLLVEWVENS